MFLDSMLELSYRKIVVNQNFSDGSIKIGLEGTLRSFSNNCAWVIYGSAVLDRLLEMEMLRQTVFLIFNLTIPHFCSVILLVLSAWGGGTATSAAAAGTFRGCVCILPSPAQALSPSSEAAQVWTFYHSYFSPLDSLHTLNKVLGLNVRLR